MSAAAERQTRILARLSASDDSVRGTRRLCRVAAEVTDMTGAGIMLAGRDANLGSLGATDSVAELVEELQYLLGEGPSVDAHRSGCSVVEADLGAAWERWSVFGPRASASGARAVFGFPLRVGVIRLGALHLYRDEPGPLSDGQHADALVMADVAARAILVMQADALPGQVASELDADANFRFVVHQAAGMVSEQLGVSVGSALARLRAHAFGTDRALADVAQDVVGRLLRLDGA